MTRGAVAAARLKQDGRVHSVFGRVCNLATANGQLVSLVAPIVGNGPVNLVIDLPDDVDFRAQGLREGQAVHQVNGTLWVGDLEIAMNSAPSWRLVLSRLNTPPEILLASLAMTKGYAGPAPAGDSAILCNAVEARVADFNQASTQLDEGRRTTAACALLGLGPGLTPAGDDFLAGYAAGLSQLAGGWTADERLLLESNLDLSSTSWLSAQKLALAMAGELDERLSNATRAILSGDPSMVEAIRQLNAIGHTSGWYTIAGICAAGRLALARASRCPS